MNYIIKYESNSLRLEMDEKKLKDFRGRNCPCKVYYVNTKSFFCSTANFFNWHIYKPANKTDHEESQTFHDSCKAREASGKLFFLRMVQDRVSILYPFSFLCTIGLEQPISFEIEVTVKVLNELIIQALLSCMIIV